VSYSRHQTDDAKTGLPDQQKNCPALLIFIYYHEPVNSRGTERIFSERIWFPKENFSSSDLIFTRGTGCGMIIHMLQSYLSKGNFARENKNN
jgi:hypothetical protein